MPRPRHAGHGRDEMAPATVFISHETYTPARGGSAAAEVNALRRVFGAAADQVVVANTKGFTGHPMGVGIEDVVAVKALETGIVPPVPNFKEPDPDLGQLNLSIGGVYPVRYALRLAAGFGSQISMMMLRWVPTPDGQRPSRRRARLRRADRRPGGVAGMARRAMRRAPIHTSQSTTARCAPSPQPSDRPSRPHPVPSWRRCGKRRWCEPASVRISALRWWRWSPSRPGIRRAVGSRSGSGGRSRDRHGEAGRVVRPGS